MEPEPSLWIQTTNKVGGQGRWRHIAAGFDEGTGDGIVVRRKFFRDQNWRGEPHAFIRPPLDHVLEDGAIGEAEDQRWDFVAGSGGGDVGSL